MIVVIMYKDATEKDVAGVVDTVEGMGLKPQISFVARHTVVGVVGKVGEAEMECLKSMDGVQDVVFDSHPWRLACRAIHPEDTEITIGNLKIGAADIVVMAGPCAVEREDWLIEIAQGVKNAGAKFLRGGAFKPRTSPYAFRGLGENGLKMLAKAKEITGLNIVTEVIYPDDVPLVAKYADVIQIGARSMQNFALLEVVGKLKKPVLLKRNMLSTIEELLLSADYLLSLGNQNVMLCERGIKTFETATRNTLDISAVPVLKNESHLPVIVDPSHSTGKREYVMSAALAAIAAGADGILVEVHIAPDKAYCDGQQSLTVNQFAKMMTQLRAVAAAVGRNIP